MTARRSGKDVLRWLAIGSCVLAMVASCGPDPIPGALEGAVRTPPLVVASVSLPEVGSSNAPLTMRARPSELYLVYFGYTSCPDVCPTTMSDISVALGGLTPATAARVTVAMVTVDPDRDTPEILTGYLGHFFDHSIALRTTDAAQLATAANAFGVKFEVGAHAPGEAYNVAHTAVTYVVDDTGTVVDEWPFGLATAAMTSDLTTLLDKERT